MKKSQLSAHKHNILIETCTGWHYKNMKECRDMSGGEKGQSDEQVGVSKMFQVQIRRHVPTPLCGEMEVCHSKY